MHRKSFFSFFSFLGVFAHSLPLFVVINVIVLPYTSHIEPFFIGGGLFAFALSLCLNVVIVHTIRFVACWYLVSLCSSHKFIAGPAGAVVTRVSFWQRTNVSRQSCAFVFISFFFDRERCELKRNVSPNFVAAGHWLKNLRYRKEGGSIWMREVCFYNWRNLFYR